MIGGIFIYNHKGEVLISRVYRDDIGLINFIFLKWFFKNNVCKQLSWNNQNMLISV